MDYLLFDLGLAPYVRKTLSYMYFVDVIALWTLKPLLLLMYPFYWILGCSTHKPYKLLTSMALPSEPVFDYTVRSEDNWCSDSEVFIFSIMFVLVFTYMWKVAMGFV